ncbi:hypothetical protein OTK49_02110 [Vibrio coralliirubri]|uniref:SIR2 family NAD-dependent protein deacylase n=1 Tax=Vibrio coralliirubri TaxID=1516159 RepID=UPI002283CA3F|nr:Sir2 family NAD-dependent protein deacetylase [Vibrio coralliirubri]MCY9861309.1 hypothetical protein [Vibrio coralliirubri]
MMCENNLALAKKIIKNADALIVYAGAGMSASGGAPTFRGDEGFWKAFPPYARLGLNFQQMACPQTFDSDLELALGFYGYRMNLYNKLVPHAGYQAIKSLFDSKKLGGLFVTSNVDGHALRAGIDIVHEEHGSICHWQCTNLTCSQINGLIKPPMIEVDEASMKASLNGGHYCGCGKPLRPNILMFWDAYFNESREIQQSKVADKFIYSLLDRKVIPNIAVIEIGAGEAIATMRAKASETASNFFTKVIRINMEPEPDSKQTGVIHLQGDSMDVLLKLTS